MVYNVHCLLHISSEANEFGCLDNCSPFSFENYLQVLKKRIRSSRRPLVQIVKLIKETDSLKNPYERDSNHTKKIKTSDIAYILDDNSVCKVVQLMETNDTTTECEVFYNTRNAFTEPLN